MRTPSSCFGSTTSREPVSREARTGCEVAPCEEIFDISESGNPFCLSRRSCTKAERAMIILIEVINLRRDENPFFLPEFDHEQGSCCERSEKQAAK